jgi:hypothetical protein
VIIIRNSISDFRFSIRAAAQDRAVALSFPFQRLMGSVLAFMKKTNRRDEPSEASRRSPKGCLHESGWAFNLATERLFSLGSLDGFQRMAYRTAQGDVRFLPL